MRFNAKLKYSIDTSAILDGWRRYYPPDVFPIIWEKLGELIHISELKAIEEVLYDLEKKDDHVYEWARNQPQLFVPIDDQIQIEVSNILQQYEKLIDTRKNRSSSDPFVIALAKIHQVTVVTGERPTNNLNKPHIPDVCNELGIRSINLLHLIREQGWVFNH